MVKKGLFFILAVTIVSCSTTKSVIVTTKDAAGSQYSGYTPKPGAKKNAPSTTKTEVIESTSKTAVTNKTIDDYIAQFKPVAQKNMKEFGIPSSIILAQGILESGAGKGNLANLANNHFGIKCHKEWVGDSIKYDDDKPQECFRKYNDPAESYRDHGLFLTSRPRYGSLFSLPKDDYAGWAKGLRAAGYATDPKYPEKLISYIERYKLHQYDAEVLGKSSGQETVIEATVKTTEAVETRKEEVAQSTPSDVKADSVANKLPEIVKEQMKEPVIEKPKEVTVPPVTNASPSTDVYEVQKGDTFYSISKKFGLTVDQLKQKNNITQPILSIGQKLIVK